MIKPKLDNYKKALKTLDEAMTNPPANLLERDGIIQRFEYCLEVSWTSAKKVLNYEEISVDTPRNIFRELAKLGWINNPEEWIQYLEARNKTLHLYCESSAVQSFNIIPAFLNDTKKLLHSLEIRLVG